MKRSLGLQEWIFGYSMAHKWIDIYNWKVSGISAYGHRKCEKCGVEQKKFPEHLWMRVTGYSWQPLVGRCPLDKKDVSKKRKKIT